jgi:radical SAM protein with 4Fe4S-binding SPASM domain
MRFKKIYLEITTRCNKNCAFCGGTTRPSEFISVENFTTRLKQVSKLGDRIYLYVAGEPLLHPNLDTLLDIAANEGASIGITTNGTLISQKFSALQNQILHELNVSLHASSENPNELEEIIAAALNIHAAREGNLLLNFRIWNGDDAKSISQTLYPILRAKFGDNIVQSGEFSRAGKHKIADNLFIHFDFPFSWGKNAPKRETGFCYGLQSHFAILCDGSVSPCCICKDGEIILGNIDNTPISKILSAPLTKSIVGGFTRRMLVDEICMKCEFIRQKFK